MGNLLVGLPTLLWFVVVLHSAVAWIRARDEGRREELFRFLFTAWFLYCIPIHLHGIIPMLRADEMTDMKAHPDLYFGAYPTYCAADPRYCSKNIFVMMLQGTTALVTTPLCALAAWGLLANTRWKYAAGLLPCAVQLWGTVAFFLEPLFGTTAIPRDSAFNFYFAYLFMNGMWLIFPGLYIVRVLSRHARG